MEDVSEVRSDGSSLLKAVYLSRLRLTRLLLEGGAYVNESNERGETPLMVACKTRHADQQSVPKAKLVKYLLESGADPNIQDKSGRTALMHACLERAGPEVVALLLGSGADPSLEDHRGSSALIHAVNTGDKETLRVLLDACKARGKEVIIITTDKLPSGQQMTKQYLNVPPSPHLADWPQAASGMPCTSPSEIELHTLPQAARGHLFTFGDCQGSGAGVAAASQPGSPTHRPGPAHGGLPRLLHLQRLNSEPWLKIPPCLLAQQTKASSLAEDLPDITPEEELSFRLNGLSVPRAPAARHQGADPRDAPCWGQGTEQTPCADGASVWGAGLSRKTPHDDVSPIRFSASHPDLRRQCAAAAAASSAGRDADCYPNLAVSSLRNILQRRAVGAEHYSSDSQLCRRSALPADDGRGLLEKRRLVSSRSSTLLGSRECAEGPAQAGRRHPAVLERRGSGAAPPDHTPHARPGHLPPLNPHAPIPHIGVTPSVGGGGAGWAGGAGGGGGDVLRPLIPTAPSFPKDHKAKKTLLRRHSMQPEQIKQLVTMEEVFSH
ncbi:ankyrin repeat domain-containing protein 34B-like [Anguilla anguilla]|uniref:ankyrin repeat domain-containing protein 34B-like n=1 Tax=Anguilla anguilla TaxID=7936 RepID=UPI0015AE847A|nr:ankyrin repeat domain-containing protein 34B-like [Anguilla anguilla]XP_035245696.1 ankyrin repeat domain-containing protein 34B-like [Anguilla anguilla]